MSNFLITWTHQDENLVAENQPTIYAKLCKKKSGILELSQSKFQEEFSTKSNEGNRISKKRKQRTRSNEEQEKRISEGEEIVEEEGEDLLDQCDEEENDSKNQEEISSAERLPKRRKIASTTADKIR